MPLKLPQIGHLLRMVGGVMTLVVVAMSSASAAAERRVVVQSGDDWNALLLRRAVARCTVGDLVAAADLLEQREAAAISDERADFLHAWTSGGALRTAPREAAGVWGARTEALGLLRSLRDTNMVDAVHREWVQRWALRSGDLLPAGELLGAQALLRAQELERASTLLGEARLSGEYAIVRDALRLHTQRARGADPAPALKALANHRPKTPVGRRLVDGARLQQAAIAVAEGRTPDSYAKLGDKNSLQRARARHLQGVTEWRAERLQQAHEALVAATQAAPGSQPGRLAARDLGLFLLASERWDEAENALSAAAQSLDGEQDSLRAVAQTDSVGLDRIWNEALAAGPATAVLAVDFAATLEGWAPVIDRALQLKSDDDPPLPPAPVFRDRPEATAWMIDEERRERIRALEEKAHDAARARDRRQREHDAEERAMERDVDYSARGVARAERELALLDGRLTHMKLLLQRAEEHASLLGRVRDEEMRRIALEMEKLAQVAQENDLLIRALVRFRAEGPGMPRHTLPEGIPNPVQILAAEDQLAQQTSAWVAAFGEHAPSLVERSCRERWVPRTTDGLREIVAAAEAQRNHAQGIHRAVVAVGEEVGAPQRLIPWQERYEKAHQQWATTDALAADLRRRLVVDAALATAEHLEAEREALDYGLAVAAQERERRGEAIGRYRAFLVAYPQSPARSEARDRLADALLLQARDRFQEQVRTFVGASVDEIGLDAARLAPFLKVEPALREYETLLAEDPEYAHIDAVLFHIGMLRGDQGDRDGIPRLEQLVRDHPQSAHAPEAHLHLGDDLFDRREFAASLPHYESATSATDPQHVAIALYKIGWARFEEDQFDSSASAFLQLIDHYESHPLAARTADLRDEAEEYLLHALSRAGGASAFARLFERAGPRPAERALLDGLGALLREYSLFQEAVSVDSLALARWPQEAAALDVAQRMVATLDQAEKRDAARAALLDLAPRFRADAAWARAIDDDSLRTAGEDFAREAYRRVALHHHHRARDAQEPAANDWQSALDLYEKLLAGWPGHAAVPTFHYYAGEAAGALEAEERALVHFDAAAQSDTASFRADAAWRAIALRDAHYERARGTAEAGPDSLAHPLLNAIASFVDTHAGDEHVADLRWRRAHLAAAHREFDRAAEWFEEFAARHADDERAAQATAAVPQSRWAAAEDLAQRHPDDPQQWASRFESLGEHYPDFEHAEQALYRAGLGWAAGERVSNAVRAWEALLARPAPGALARDAQLKIAELWESEKESQRAAAGYERFAERFSEDRDAATALLRAADLYAEAEDDSARTTLHDRYLERFPEDIETAFAILEARVERELDGVSVSNAPSALEGDSATALYHWLELSRAHEARASRALRARLRFLRAEESHRRCDSVPLRLPLASSIAKKKKLLEETLLAYRDCAELGVTPWNRAAAYRIGESLVAFGDELQRSERPADLQGDDRLAYEEVLEDQSWTFFDRGEETWTELLRSAQPAADGDEWVARTRAALWPRLAQRFAHRPEVEYPLLIAQESTPPRGDR